MRLSEKAVLVVDEVAHARSAKRLERVKVAIEGLGDGGDAARQIVIQAPGAVRSRGQSYSPPPHLSRWPVG
jgi:glutamate dehydrogenase/leucine dehydrogenase